MLEIPNNDPYLPWPWVLQSFTKSPNPITHLMVNSFKKIKKKIRPLNPTISLANSFLLHLITCAFVTRIYSCN